MERELIGWLADNIRPLDETIIGIGDDAAVLPRAGNLVVTSDTVCDGVHFDTGKHTPSQIGHKALAVNLSDVAAMGGTPHAVVVSLVLPANCSMTFVKELFAGMKRLADRHAVSICGGDTCSWDQRLSISVTAFGHYEGNGPWLISTAKPGQRIIVTGPLGGSITNKHICFEPRCGFAKQWAPTDVIRAATDISDSLSIDLAKMASASGTGFRLDADKIPIAEDALKLADGDEESALKRALSDGEDFELILAVDSEDVEELIAESEPLQLSDIGTFTESDLFEIVINGVHRKLEPIGFEHKFATKDSNK